MSNYTNLLSCWHKLEHFSPATLPKNIKDELYKDSLLWNTITKKTEKNRRIEHTIYLGVFNSSEVSKFVKDYFNDATDDPNSKSANLCHASNLIL